MTVCSMGDRRRQACMFAWCSSVLRTEVGAANARQVAAGRRCAGVGAPRAAGRDGGGAAPHGRALAQVARHAHVPGAAPDLGGLARFL